MRRIPKEGIRRLSILVGALAVPLCDWRSAKLWNYFCCTAESARNLDGRYYESVPWFFVAASGESDWVGGPVHHSGVNLIALAVLSGVFFFAGWFAVRVLGWVLSGFLAD
jgi:hypothetical protein